MISIVYFEKYDMQKVMRLLLDGAEHSFLYCFIFEAIDYEDAMPVAQVHAVVTDQTWQQIVEYESLYWKYFYIFPLHIDFIFKQM